MPRHIPTVTSRRLTSELRRIREESEQNWTHEQVAEVLGWHASKMYRIENDKVGILLRDVRRLLDLYEVEGEEREALLTLARLARNKEGWWHRYGDVLPRWFGMYVGLEADAATLRNYQSELVPGLMQTEDYARALMRAEPRPESDEEIERLLAVRMNRQELFTREQPPELWVVLNEAVIRRTVGSPATMRGQLQRLNELGALPNVTLQVLSFKAGAHPSMYGGFTILGLPGGARNLDVAYVEYRIGALYLEDTADVDSYRLVFEHVCARALGPDQSAEFIQGAIDRLK